MKTLPSAFSLGLRNVINIFYPHLCAGCGADINGSQAALCYKCLHQLPVTNFHNHPGNLVERIFWGRLPVHSATSLCYFTKDTLVQQILHQLKYKGNKAVGSLLGRMLGETILISERFNDVDLIIPLPLHPRKQRMRGFNQAEMIGNGIAEVTRWPLMNNVMQRNRFTGTQTHRSRIDRWDNMKERFECSDGALLSGKHVLLVDDLVTTGATLEACGMEILRIPGARLSIATVEYAVK